MTFFWYSYRKLIHSLSAFDGFKVRQGSQAPPCTFYGSDFIGDVIKKCRLMKSLKKLNPSLQVAEISLTYSNPGLTDRITVKDSQTAYQVFLDNWSSQIELVEEMNLLLLDQAHQVLGIHNIARGGLASTIVDVRLIFASAVLAKATRIILCHNHPSQQCKPSKADISITQKIKEAGKVMDIPLLDHLIITSQNGYYSFADEGSL